MDSLLEPTLLLVNVDRQILPGHVVLLKRYGLVTLSWCGAKAEVAPRKI